MKRRRTLSAELMRTAPTFSGQTYDPVHDQERLSTLLADVRSLMRDGKWRTLAQIREELRHGSEAGISARLRDLRKSRFGGHTVNRKRVGEAKRGLFVYQLVEAESPCL